MFVVRLIIYFFFFFQNNPDAHRFGSRPLYIFTNPTSPHQRFCPRRFHSKCKEAILEIKHRQILTPRYKNGTRELNEEQLFVHENVSCCLLRVVGMNLHTIHTCTYTICPEMESFFFMVFLSLQRQTAEDRAESSGHHLKCVCLFNLPFLHQWRCRL